MAPRKALSSIWKPVKRTLNRRRKAVALPLRLALVRLLSKLGLERWNVPLLCSQIEGGCPHPEGRTVLCLGRQNFAKDIEELRKRTSINWLTLRHKFVGHVQIPWTPERVQQQMFHFCQTGPDVEAARERSVKFFRRFIAALRQRRIHAVMTANTDYWQDEAIRDACRLESFPFLVLSREHYITREKARVRVDRYRSAGFRYNGTAVAVFGPQTVRTLLDADVCEPERIRMTGAPRLDQWRDRPPPEAPGNTFLLISFARPQYGAQACNRDVFATFSKFADECPDSSARFVVKCKNEEDRELVLELLAEFPSHKLQVVLGESLMDLIGESRAVIGFNSLGLLEALLGPGRIAVPDWADAAANPANRMLDPDDADTRACVDFCSSADALRAWLAGLAAQRPGLPDRMARLRLLQQYFHFPAETSCSSEVARFVEEYTVGEA